MTTSTIEHKRETIRGPIPDDIWQTFMEGINGFTDDFFADGREQGVQQERSLQP